ncbi:hypothetical protein AB0I60_19600 [Actinosynnema sp. NPDC050436]|uniref:RICIN domain-containing protein n=1 Tax=Actinosynnema sp. NPDC050436 TaxID=3155659 RepID=UPI0033D98C3A
MPGNAHNVLQAREMSVHLAGRWARWLPVAAVIGSAAAVLAVVVFKPVVRVSDESADRPAASSSAGAAALPGTVLETPAPAPPTSVVAPPAVAFPEVTTARPPLTTAAPQVPPAAAPAPPHDLVCLPAGTRITVENHDSNLWLTVYYNRSEAGERAVMGTPTEPQFRLVHDSADPCVHRMITHSSRDEAPMCLTAPAAPEGEVAQYPCRPGAPDQQWVLENHWEQSPTQLWRHLKPAHDRALCAQQRDPGRAEHMPVVLHRCGTEWQQQWGIGSPAR